MTTPEPIGYEILGHDNLFVAGFPGVDTNTHIDAIAMCRELNEAFPGPPPFQVRPYYDLRDAIDEATSLEPGDYDDV
jgi:hypothetical protein